MVFTIAGVYFYPRLTQNLPNKKYLNKTRHENSLLTLVSFHIFHGPRNYKILMQTICIHLCISVAETPENEPVEPQPMVKFVLEPEENQGKQLRIIPCAYLFWFSLVISLIGYLFIYIMIIYCIVVPTFLHYPSLIGLSGSFILVTR